MLAAGSILALCTPPGRSARAMVRLSGPQVPGLVQSWFPECAGRSAHRAVLRLGRAELPVLVMFFPAPHSYTGEDVLEVQLPGNPSLVERLTAAFKEVDGIRAAGPGEFTARAYLNHRLTLDQAEGVALTIAAESEADLAAAQRLTSGRTGAQYRAWADELATLLALVESGIDFTDQEDVVPIAPADLRARLEKLSEEIAAMVGARAGRAGRDALPLVALAGAPNAGKSTLFNALLGRRRAVTNAAAGTTRDVLAEPLDLSRDAPGAPTVMLADVAGLDDQFSPPSAQSPTPEATIDTLAQARACETLALADVVLHCDPAARFVPLPSHQAEVLRVRTKADLAPGPDEAGWISVCALDGRNMSLLRRRIASAIRSASAGHEAILAPRHRAALATSHDRLADAISTIAPGRPLPAELTAGRLREALDSIGELTGRITPDDILGRVFSTFCIGK
jgi:tRNA modification GTPase